MRGAMAIPGVNQRITRKALVIPALTVFIAVDIILVALAFGWGRDAPEAAESNPPDLSPALRAEGHGASGSEIVVPTPSPHERANPMESVPRLLSSASETLAWRSEGGSCDEAGSLELATDGGETWDAAYPTADTLGRTLRISTSDFTAVQSAVATGANCELRGVRSFDSGSSWSNDGQVVTNSVLVDPQDASEVIWGGESVQGPCRNMTQVAVTRNVASVVFGDGLIWRAPSDDSDWIETGVENAVAVSGSDGRWIAVIETKDCDGLGLVESSDPSVKSLACLPDGSRGSIALDVIGNTVWLLVEDQLFISTDLGRTLKS